MRKSLILSVVAAFLLLAGTSSILSSAQDPATDLKPTFISPIPGLYVHGWPAFTVSYPKEWVACRPVTGEAFCAGGTRTDLPPDVYSPLLRIAVLTSPLSLGDWAKLIMPGIQRTNANVEVVSDTPTHVKDGTPARELDIEGDPTFAPGIGPLTDVPRGKSFSLLIAKGFVWVMVTVSDEKVRFHDGLKKHVYSITFLPRKEEPVEVPPDVRAFLDMYCADIASHDVTSVMAHYSDRFLHSGAQKGFWEGIFRRFRDFMPVQSAATVTVFESHGDRASIDGFFLDRGRDEAASHKAPMVFQQIIKEQGRWKWFGNQR
jgi:hypothetical protein